MQSQHEAALWEARAQVETLNMQLALTATSPPPANRLRPRDRVTSLIQELSMLLDDPTTATSLATDKHSDALARLLRQVVTQYRRQCKMPARRRGSAGQGQQGEIQQLGGLIDGDSFDSVNTGERDESDFWDVSTSIDEET